MSKDLEARKIFEETQEEPGYTAGEVEKMLYSLGISECNATTIRKHAIDKGLAVDVSQMLSEKGVKIGRGFPKYLIRQSEVRILVEGMGYNVPVGNLEEAMRKIK